MANPVIDSMQDRAPSATPATTASPDAWRTLMQGGWLVVSHAREQGVRSLVAWSMPGLPGSELLTADEMRVVALRGRAAALKNIAFDVGHSESWVASCVSSAMRKLMLHTEADLVGFFAAWPDGAAASIFRHDHGRRLELTYRPPSWRLPGCLSSAERDVVCALLEGGSTQAVARGRGVAPRTIANQLASIYRKLKVCSRLELLVALSGREERA